MIYAPVRIHTLNRYEKFKACFESLERCTGADQTEVFIGIDYPPSDKYVEGWKLITEFMKEKELSHPFKALHVYYRNHNCGVGNPNSNAALLHKEVISRFDRFISSEDDNIFSPNFLEYINKGLEKFKDDQSVYAIVGYSHPYSFKYAENNFFRHNTDMSAWGYATWVDKDTRLKQFVAEKGFVKSFCLRNVLKAKKHGWLRLFDYIYYSYHKGFTRQTDGLVSIYMIINDIYVILPSISKVRNIGWDNSGYSFKNGLSGLEEVAKRHNTQIIDSDNTFEFKGDEWSYVDYNNRIAVKESDGYMSFLQFVKKLFTSYFCKNIKR